MVLNDEMIEIVSRADIFSSVKVQNLKNVLNGENTFFKTYKNGTVIFSSLCYTCAIGVIVSGSAQVKNERSSVLVSQLSQGDVFGCQSLFLGNDAFDNVITAKGQTTVLYILKPAVLTLLQNESGFVLDYIRYLSGRVRFLTQKITGFTCGSAQSRLANFLLEGFSDYKTFELDMPMSRLAGCLNIARASLYRALCELEENGIIEKNGKVIRLLDRDKLCACIEK